MILPALALAILAVGLAGCRSRSRTAPQTAAAPGTTYVAPPPTTTYVPPPTPSAPPPPSFDGAIPPSSSDFGGFESVPDPAPAPTLTQADVEAMIRADRDARRQAEAQLDALQRKIDRLNESLSQPPAPVQVRATAPTAPVSGGETAAARFAEELRAGTRGEVELNGSIVIVRLSDVFQPGSEELKGDSSTRTTLMAAAAALLRYPTSQVAVVGHSDGQPIRVTKERWTDNVHLSRERAQTVAQELARNGVPSSRLAVDGRGSVEPLVFPERTAADRARNRRVEIHVRF
jgi:flagellar motor protein MotB